MRNRRALSAGAAALAMAVIAAPASAAGYLKIPDIPGESKAASDGVETEDIGFKPPDMPQKKDSGEAHLDYLTITLSNANEGKKAIGPVRWMAPESTRDAATGLPTGKRQHKPLTATKEVDKASPARMSTTTTAGSTTGAAGAGKVKYDRLTMKKKTDTMSTDDTPPARLTTRYRPMSGPTATGGLVRLAAAIPACEVGTAYPHVLVGMASGREVKLIDATVMQCAAEEVTLTYERIKWEY